jgi:hypothetical protein
LERICDAVATSLTDNRFRKMLFTGRISRSKLLAIFLLISLHTIAITNVLADQGVAAEQGPTLAELKREGDTFARAGKFADAGRSYSRALGMFRL